MPERGAERKRQSAGPRTCLHVVAGLARSREPRPHRRSHKRRRAPSADPRGAQSSLRARRSPSESALPAAGGGVRRRRASAASSVSRRSLRSSLRLPLCSPLASLLPLPELRRVPATLCATAGTKEGPRGGGSATSACGSYPLPARGGGGGGSRAPGSPISEASARPHRAGVARKVGSCTSGHAG